MKKRYCAIPALVATAYATAVTWPPAPPGWAYESDLKPHSMVITNTTAAGIALKSDLNKLTENLPEIIEEKVRDTKGLVYDEKLDITWQQTMYDGNLYYIAVTNANITEIK